MPSSPSSLERTVERVLETLPPVWDRIRSNLRAGGTGRFGITLEQFHVLRHIRRGCSTVSELAETRQVSRPAVSQAVSILVDKGLVERRQEGGDRRCVQLVLTERAAGLLDANRAETRAWMRERMGSLSAADLGCVQRAMDVLADAFLEPDRTE
jgi:DNA-binding MarR family transcriptional regulator